MTKLDGQQIAGRVDQQDGAAAAGFRIAQYQLAGRMHFNAQAATVQLPELPVWIPTPDQVWGWNAGVTGSIMWAARHDGISAVLFTQSAFNIFVKDTGPYLQSLPRAPF